MYTGIDYGNGLTNKNQITGIRFGVIPSHDVLYWDDSEIIYSNCCPFCGNEGKKPIQEYKRCPHCRKTFNPDRDFDDQSPIGYKLDNAEYFASQRYDDCDIFIERSPYFTYAQFCSPCAPGACYLRNPIPQRLVDNRCYCFGHDFFADNIAPYSVYSVETGKKIC
jgi:hypothetical protein